MIKEIIDVVKHSQHILLAAHVSPDGDAMGALVGVANICSFLEIPYTVLVEQVPEEYAFITQNICIKDQFEGFYDTVISLDCGDVARLGKYKAYFERAKTTINIDHHETNNGFAKYNYVKKDASSTCELIFNIIELAQIPLTQSIVQAIYTGLVTDTGGFMHSCTQPSTHIAVAKLLTVPFDFSTIYYKLIHQKTEKTIGLQSMAVSHLTKLCDGKVFLSYITEKDLEAYQASREDASSIVSYIKNIIGCEVAVFIYPGKEVGAYKISLRSNAPYNVAEFAAHFNGGGHIRAAGATIEGTLEAVVEKVKSHLKF
jgi:phosphoesterase RecJ-like protein